MASGKRNGLSEKVTFREALFLGQAPDKGLFMPTSIPRLSSEDLFSLRGKAYHEVAREILKMFLSDEIKENDLNSITKDVYDFDLPIEMLNRFTYIMRLDRGPTASFKDFSAGFMAQLMHRLKPPDKTMRILVASSGDTGSAVGQAFKRLNGFEVFILYPEQEVSPFQKKQMNQIGDNVKTIAIQGKFDDCQKLVKEAFSDPDMKMLNCTSANSVNIGRIFPQVVYYFYSYLKVADSMRPVIFSIPSGNFGNSLGCELARRMGLPVEKIIVATNENDEFPRYLSSGVYKKKKPSVQCLSSAMNVGNPSNLARYFDLYGGILDKDGTVHKKTDLGEMKKHIYSVSISDQETIETIQHVYRTRGIIIEPHGAVGIAALLKYFKENKKQLSICLETAHPAKFSELLKKELGIVPPVPTPLRNLDEKERKPDCLPPSYKAFKEYLLKKNKMEW